MDTIEKGAAMGAAEIQDGDIFRWSYAHEKDAHGAYAYWCKSRIAVAGNGVLHDTYWGLGRDQSSHSWSYDVAVESLLLERIGNFNDFEKAPEYRAPYFADADILNLNHPNAPRGNFYTRKGAEPCRKRMLEHACSKLRDAQSKLHSAAYGVEFAARQIQKIEDGRPVSEISL